MSIQCLKTDAFGSLLIDAELTVYFQNGKATLGAKYRPQLLELVQKAQTTKGYIIQVEGYAS